MDVIKVPNQLDFEFTQRVGRTSSGKSLKKRDSPF